MHEYARCTSTWFMFFAKRSDFQTPVQITQIVSVLLLFCLFFQLFFISHFAFFFFHLIIIYWCTLIWDPVRSGILNKYDNGRRANWKNVQHHLDLFGNLVWWPGRSLSVTCPFWWWILQCVAAAAASTSAASSVPFDQAGLLACRGVQNENEMRTAASPSRTEERQVNWCQFPLKFIGFNS